MDSESAIQELEDFIGHPLGPPERELIGDLTPGERVRYLRKRKTELGQAKRAVAIQQAHAALIRKREKLTLAISERLTKVLGGASRTVEEPVPLQVDPRTGALSVGQWPDVDTDTCRRATPVPGREHLREFLQSQEHLPLRLEPFTVEEDVPCTLHGAAHPAALVFAGIEDARKLGLSPCSCGGDPAKHRYQAKDVQARVGPYVWRPGTEFDSPCPEADQDLETFVRAGHVENRLKGRKEAPEAPAPPSAAEVLAARLEELASGRGAKEAD